MNNRDDFSQKTKDALAHRASWHCSFTDCGKSTVGPSEESPKAVTKIGKAAHISGASPGPGSRRYDPSMTQQERRSIDNAIWLCANHADLIDRDEVTYPVDVLRAMKKEHEALCGKAVRTGTSIDLGAGLLAIGPEVICMGGIEAVSGTTWTLRLKHFVTGNVHQLIAFIDQFAKTAAEDRYVLSNELGDGRVLSNTPTLTKQNDGYSLLCPIEPGFPRIDARNLGSSSALHPETNDLYLDEKGNLARVAGLDFLPQMIQSVLSMQRGESVFHPNAGIRFYVFFEEYKGSPWLAQLMTLDVVRLASIPFTDALNRQYTPLQCIARIRSFELLSETPENNRIPMRVDFEVQGVGRWQRELSIYMPTKEQMDERAKIVAQRSPTVAVPAPMNGGDG
jgi:hypothetical protein